MRKHRAAWLFGLASIAIVTSARTAHALGPVDVEVGAKGGVGAEYSGGLNPLGFGVGGRAGVVLPTRRMTIFDHVYVGGSLMYYFGPSGTYSLGPSGGYYTESIHTLTYGGEVGLGFKPLDSVTIRPQVGLGNASFDYTISGPCPLSPGNSSVTTCPIAPGPDAAHNSLYVEPGVTVLVALGTLFVGADLNVLLFPGSGWDGAGFFITVHGQVGVKF